MENNFEILGLSENATKEEVEKAYEKLKTKYSRDRFLEGEAGNNAAKKLTKVENAYQEIMESFSESNDKFETIDFSAVEDEIRNGNYDKAQSLLDGVFNKNAEWHYLQSVVFYKKNWLNESKKQLEIALSMEPNNSKYNDAYSKLRQKVDVNSQRFNNSYNNNAYYGQNNYSQNQYNNNNRQMGGTDMGSCVDCCATWCCMELLCNGCR